MLTLLTISLLAALPQVKAAVSWSGVIQFTTDISYDTSPAMTQTKDKRIWMFWASNPPPSYEYDIFYNYTDNQGRWSKAYRLTTDSHTAGARDEAPAAVTTREGKVWVFFETNRTGPPGNVDIYYKTSTNNGATWSYNQPVGDIPSSFYDKRPSAMQDHTGSIWVVWYSGRDGNTELYYNIFDGTWWGLDQRLTNNPNPDQYPCILQDDLGKIWVFWSAKRGSHFALYYKTSIDYGLNWSTETQITVPGGSDDELNSVIQAQDGTIWLVWARSSSDAKSELYYKTSSNYGANWSSDALLVSQGSRIHCRAPTIFQAANTTMYVAWSSDLYGDTSAFDIFYKATLTDHDVAVKSVTPTANAYQGYQSNMSITVKNDGMYSETFTVTAYYDSAPIGTQTVTDIAPSLSKTLNFTWDTTGLPFGYYTNLWSANASKVTGEADFTDNYLASGTVLVTIPGDINGDRTVDILDKGVLSAHWTGAPDSLGYDRVADINNDGLVNIAEVSILNSHWGESW